MPSLAPVNLRAHNKSSTSLLVAWEPLPDDEVNGILLGYKVTYRKHKDVHVRKQNLSTVLNSTILAGLDKFTAYDVSVSAFTLVGNGPEGNVTASTDEDGKKTLNACDLLFSLYIQRLVHFKMLSKRF